MSRTIVLVDAAGAAQTADVPLGDQIEVVEEGRHRRIEPVALAELQSQALGEVAGARCRPGRRSGSPPSSVSTRVAAAADQLGRRVEVVAEIARLVDQIDETAADRSVDRIGDGDVELADEMVPEGDGIGGAAFERRSARADGVDPGRGDIGCAGGGVRLGGIDAFEQRVAFKLPLDIGRQLEVRKLQQPRSPAAGAASSPASGLGRGSSFGVSAIAAVPCVACGGYRLKRSPR